MRYSILVSLAVEHSNLVPSFNCHARFREPLVQPLKKVLEGLNSNQHLEPGGVTGKEKLAMTAKFPKSLGVQPYTASLYICTPF